MEAVKNYLTTIQQKNWSELTSKNSSAWIMAVQIALEKRGFDVGKVDGIFGAGTKAAVREFQKENGISADGLPGPQTIAKLLEGTPGTPETPANTTGTPAETPGTPAETTGTPAGTPGTPETPETPETLEKMDLTKVNIDVLKKVYGETIDENWKGFQEKRNVIEI
jgi:putative hydrolase